MRKDPAEIFDIDEMASRNLEEAHLRMGGPGSGNRWRYGAKSTTDDYRTLDVRRWAREGLLRPGYWGGWQWTRDGETVASIQMRAPCRQ